MTHQHVNLIQQLSHEAVPADSIPVRTIELLVELGLVTIDDGQARLVPDGVVFESLVSPDGVTSSVHRDFSDSERYGGYNKEVELKNADLTPDRKPRDE